METDRLVFQSNRTNLTCSSQATDRVTPNTADKDNSLGSLLGRLGRTNTMVQQDTNFNTDSE